MTFHSDFEVEDFIHSLNYLGQGSQGVTYVDQNLQKVYKIYYSYFDHDYEGIISKEDILQFHHVKSSTFVFPSDVLLLNGQVIGDVTSYKKARNLYQLNPLEISLNRFLKCIDWAVSDIKKITREGIVCFDMMYNILLGSRIYIIDTLEYHKIDGYYEETLRNNLKGLSLEVMYFLVDGLFLDVINTNQKLKEMYYSKGNFLDIVDFIWELKNTLSKLLGHEITYLKEAQSLKDVYEDDTHLKYQRDVLVLERLKRN